MSDGTDGPTGGAEGPEGEPAPRVAEPRRKRRRVVRQGTETTPVEGATADDSPESWGETPRDDGNDERLRRDVPPHW